MILYVPRSFVAHQKSAPSHNMAFIRAANVVNVTPIVCVCGAYCEGHFLNGIPIHVNVRVRTNESALFQH